MQSGYRNDLALQAATTHTRRHNQDDIRIMPAAYQCLDEAGDSFRCRDSMGAANYTAAHCQRRHA